MPVPNVAEFEFYDVGASLPDGQCEFKGSQEVVILGDAVKHAQIFRVAQSFALDGVRLQFDSVCWVVLSHSVVNRLSVKIPNKYQ